MQHPALVVVQTCGNRLEADLAMSALESAGIQAMLQADSVGGMREHMAWSGAGFEILVRVEDAAAALDALTPPVANDTEGADSQFDPDARSPLRKFT